MHKKETQVIKTSLLLFFVVVISLVICGTVTADEYVGGSQPINVQNGTVSGGVYTDSYYGFSSSTPKNVTYNFQALPNNAEVTSATLYTVVYCGNMKEDKPVNLSVNFNNQKIAQEYLSSTYTWPGEAGTGTVIINDHCNRVTSDYLLWYDVTSLVKQNNFVQVAANPSDFDGRIKLITLLVTYNDGDSDLIRYWINLGHDTDTKNQEEYLGTNYIGQTTFNSNLPPGSTIQNSTLKVFHLSSSDGKYTFNNNIIPAGSPQGSYSGSNTWDVTGSFNNGVNTLTYDRQADYYKIYLALLTVKYTETTQTKPDLLVSGFNVPGNVVVDQSYQLGLDVKNGGSVSAGSFLVKLLGNGVELSSKTVSGLIAGGSSLVQFNWTPSSVGTINLQVVLDPSNQVNESDETNNQASKSVTVSYNKPDLLVSGFNVPGNVVVDQSYQLGVDVKNGGSVSAGSFLVKLLGNGVELSSKTVSGLIAGGSSLVQFNWTPSSVGTINLQVVLDPSNQVNESDETNNQADRQLMVKKAAESQIFIISDQSSINILNQAAHELLSQLGNLSIQLRTNDQIKAMNNTELKQYLKNCDVFIGEWISTDAATKLLEILEAQPELVNNKVFLILEPPLSTKPDSVKLYKYNTVKNVSILNGFSNAQLTDYYQHTKRGLIYQQVLDYLETVNFPEILNQANLYKNLNDKDNFKNQILWALNLTGMMVSYQEPKYSSDKQDYGIYRYHWYVKKDPVTGAYIMDLESYMKEYFQDGLPAVGLIESTMYVDNQQLQPYYAIIDALEERGMNVIPVTAYGGTTAQLDVMVRAFTSAPDYQSFINNPSKYEIYVDAIVEMPAYGLGADNFSEVVQFLTALNVPVVRAIHSDNYSNEEWELSPTGLPTIGGDKWWHISILEAQGIILYTFVGGQNKELDPETGASIMGYTPQMKNIELMAQRIKQWVNLKYLADSQKKVALIYYNYPPGKDNVGGSYLDTITSLYNLLKILKNNGYTVENLPTDAQALLEMIIGNKEKNILPLGINVANWAPGELEKLANHPQVIMYPVSDYLVWFNGLDEMTRLQVTQGPVAYIGELCKKAVALNYTEDMEARVNNWYSGMLGLLPDNKMNQGLPLLDNIKQILTKYLKTGETSDYNQFLTYKNQFLALDIEGMGGWGEPPGNIMVVKKNGVEYFVIPGIQFGNVFIGPEPQRGWEADINQLYHSTVVAPPHQYLAYYAYLQSQDTSAMVFMGRHATHEWLPGKEVVLSSYDFPSVVIGTVPQIYYYEVDGLAEAIQAKRRGFAVMISHLTPPLTFTELYGDLGKLATLADDYENADNSQKETIINGIKKIIQTNNYDLGVNTASLNNDQLVAALNNYLADLQSTIYPYGLHAIGSAWSDDEIVLLVSSILSVPYELSVGGSSTTIQDEIAFILYGKSYNTLSVLDKNQVQAKCMEVLKTLIANPNPNQVAGEITTNPSAKLIFTLNKAKEYINLINLSVEKEIASLINALNGGYVAPGAGGDPVNNPDVLPTGTNMFDDQSAEIPTKKAYQYAKQLALLTMKDMTDDTDKIAVGIWCVETARDNGALVAMVLYLLGMEPQWSDSPSAGVNGAKLKEMPKYVELEDLVRPEGWTKKRIDVVVITSGLFRDLYSRQAGLLDNAFRVALARSYYTIINNPQLKAKFGNKLSDALDPIMSGIGSYGLGSETLEQNYVAQHWVEDFEHYLAKGMNSQLAGEMAISRIFAPPGGDYGAGISKSASMSWTWEDRMDLAQNYLQRMGNIYTNKNWGTNNPDVFAQTLSGISDLYTSRNTNLYGVLDNDDFFDYWGGLSMALEYVNGQAPSMFVLDYANQNSPQSLSLEQYMNREMTSRYFNPNWIQGMMDQGYSGSRYMSKKFVSNLWGWQVTRPDNVQNWMWNQVVDVYLNDKYNIGVTNFLTSRSNTFSMTSLTGTLLNAAYSGSWVTNQATLQQVANMYSQMVVQGGVTCCDCSCGNLAMMKWATNYMNADLLAQFNTAIYAATQSSSFAPGSNPTNPSDGSTGGGGQSGLPSGGDGAGQNPHTGAQASGFGSSAGASGSGGRAYEISKEGSASSAETGMPIAAIAGILLLISLVGVGYFRNNISGLFDMFKK